MIRRIIVGDNERVVLIRKRRFESILEPGVYWVFGAGVEAEAHSTRYPELSSEWGDFIATQRPEVAAAHFTVVETGDCDVAVVSFDGKLARVVGPGQRVLFWRAAVEVTFERIDVVAEPEVPTRLVAPLARLGQASLAQFTLVDEGKHGLVHLDGRLIRELAPGAYSFWTAVAQPKVTITELRRQTLEVTGQEILTADKVAIRVNVSALFEVVNASAAQARRERRSRAPVPHGSDRGSPVPGQADSGSRCWRRRRTLTLPWPRRCGATWNRSAFAWA